MQLVENSEKNAKIPQPQNKWFAGFGAQKKENERLFLNGK
jgi:hypothetical protein